MSIPVTYPNATHASPHFTWAELRAEGNRATPAQRAKLAKLANLVLEPIRMHFGKPVTVTDGFRTRGEQEYLWNVAIKRYGSAVKAREFCAKPGHSQHEGADAADIVVQGVSPAAVAAFAATLAAVGGVGLYGPAHGNFTHVDMRSRWLGRVVRWGH